MRYPLQPASPARQLLSLSRSQPPPLALTHSLVPFLTHSLPLSHSQEFKMQLREALQREGIEAYPFDQGVIRTMEEQVAALITPIAPDCPDCPLDQAVLRGGAGDFPHSLTDHCGSPRPTCVMIPRSWSNS